MAELDQPVISSPQRYLLRMVLFLVAVAAVAASLFEPLVKLFMANAILNGVILSVLALGIIVCFRQVVALWPEVRWIQRFRPDDPKRPWEGEPSLLAPMATMLRERPGRVSLSATAFRSLLDSISIRLDEGRETSRYIIALLVFLGLLGTFWGLQITVGTIGETIAGLTVGEDLNATFNQLKAGLAAPLTGMATAFSASLLGLAGSLIVGFLELQASQAQDHFYRDVEEWLSGFTRLGGGTLGGGDGETSVPAYVQALLEQTAESLDKLQRIMSRTDDGRTTSEAMLLNLAEKLATLTDQLKVEQDMLVKLARSQMEVKPLLERMTELLDRPGGGDAANAGHLRNIDLYVGKLLEEVVRSRKELAQDIRDEIKLLARTIAAVADQRRDR